MSRASSSLQLQNNLTAPDVDFARQYIYGYAFSQNRTSGTHQIVLHLTEVR